MKNYFVTAGLNSVGIIMGPGLGQMMARWIMTGNPQCDITGVNMARLHPFQNNPEYRRHRTVESLGMVYQCHYPYLSMKTARGARKSAIYERLKSKGAYFRDVSGWEGADWFAPTPQQAAIENMPGAGSPGSSSGRRNTGPPGKRGAHGYVIHAQIPGPGKRQRQGA